MLLTLAAMAALGQPVREEDATEQRDVVVTATRAPIQAQDAPVTVSVKNADEIADELATDIKDLVRFEPGISVRRAPTRFGAALGTTGRAGNEGFVVRGIGGNRVLIQVDGVRVPYGFSFGAQDVGRGDYVDLGLIKSVEFLRGPASALYGSDGLAGAVSFTTSDPADILGGKTFGGSLRTQYNSADEEFTQSGVVAGRSGAVSAMLAYTRRDFSELKNKGDVEGTGVTRTAPNPQDGRANALLGKLVWDVAPGHRLRATGEYLDNRIDTDVLTGINRNVAGLQARDTGKRWRAGLDWTYDGAGLVQFARAAAYVQDANNRQFSAEDRVTLADRTRLNTLENRVYGGSGEIRLGFSTGPITHRLVTGADISVLRQRGLRDGTVPPAGEIFPTRAFPTTDFTLAGAFVGDEIGIGPLTLHPALRYDWYRLSPDRDPLLPRFVGAAQSADRLSPRIGAVLNLAPALRLFASYARGFRAPEPGQINQFFSNLAFGYTSIPNPNLRPETSEAIEAGLRLNSEAVDLSASVFRADYRDFISQEVVGGTFTPADPALYQFVNLDRAKVKGAEARFEGRARNGLTGQLALSYAEGEQIAANDARRPLATVDPLKLVMGIGWREPDHGRFGGQVIMTHSARKAARDTTGLFSTECFRPAAFTILDATLFARVTDALTLRAGIFNLTNATYAWWSDVRGLGVPRPLPAGAADVPPIAFTQPGRNASASLTLRF
ncbi:TonB-dependent hemoglobin/transferrin/lactoferrin family receptor [Sphingomonas sp. Leaf257]|jgi:hemoglobin/transferrin/lactoferrin receptor protein|uniref:TonB-dependent hemoglobin/transferrin/lactoferrin family receptor n=1 Tax=Sphingomonas sp. Leaf257 TaxID=1736309 RepID=UPI0006F89B85|nr:TonB-dependent hemoglobin/transferrin/lactoferrin family receptor [Sphingomonas sp. Leaf257]KQO49832.1 TonB-dependent receptor [Sphingomonas sp. Leaf257]